MRIFLNLINMNFYERSFLKVCDNQNMPVLIQRCKEGKVFKMTLNFTEECHDF